MAATRANMGYQATFSIGTNASPIVYTAMLEVKSIKLDGYTVAALDATHLLSPNATEEKIPALIHPGTLEMTGNFIGDATQQNITTQAQGRVVFPWKITSPVDLQSKVYTATGLGFVGKYSPGEMVNGRLIEFSLSIEVSGNITETVV